MSEMSKAEVLRALVRVWSDFSTALDTVPLIAKLQRGAFRAEDYRLLLLGQRQQVIEGSRWIARAASGVDEKFLDLRSMYLRHAVAEHRDYQMLENDYVSAGGKAEDIRTAEKNIGTEALHGYMFHKSSQPNPFSLLGAMFIIEGLGQHKASEWGRAIRDQLKLEDKQVSFLLYHAANDEGHMEQFDEALGSGILDIPGMGRDIVKTAKVVARLYRLQLEEAGNT
jgi:3-oxoacyl-[acyl-carrier-protein] synthase-3